ncbi:permease [Metallumcola ferriviriculae]|uniref:Permease n=1 Tax=Metallumcola ferriviriculae TaxID=3039180 RepID=A0AAU0ULW7_9FIRM|nr:permease [Desulfitibacteraceae bacterium MK1]
MSFTGVLYIASALGLLISFLSNRSKTKQAVKKAYKAFSNIFADLAMVLLLVGLMMTYISPQIIGRFLGNESGVLGVAVAAIIGSVTLIPGFVAFPLAASLLNQGAGLVPIAAFVSTLMMVGVVTLPVEIKYFGRKQTFLRNGLSFIYAIVVALLLGVLLS